ncbi:hypothetical protein FJ941_28585 [Mesorhizobium sp. B2-3-13]|uniref:hypothetical protein n=1 Tax=unclassified Mesorhizobium TaxID=325217 RepID=UPI0011277F4E|nr:MULTISPECIES: hypothetical protein [unclassified Mesorhizobium]TPJ43508.1 hypothetical protein FJ432_06165 [Mesorhizobium sp. B2-6-5]TPJ93311.1 hypothetical protein FJ434_01030 [Mesorhizobium sp. B2-5-13]TPK47604.1 hypothetical protein FJ560_17255 [Mesorhizobium sp. B2-5-5]TPL71835.1 hypothetical protein FJ941_28585 [Mesorhizobium sp. B2-3-13]
MKTAIVCAAIVLAVSSAAMAHEKKKPTVTAEKTCAGMSIKAAAAAKLDCTATGTANSPQTDMGSNSKPRLGYETSSPQVFSFGL